MVHLLVYLMKDLITQPLKPLIGHLFYDPFLYQLNSRLQWKLESKAKLCVYLGQIDGLVMNLNWMSGESDPQAHPQRQPQEVAVKGLNHSSPAKPPRRD
jgi:hypothetical protein